MLAVSGAQGVSGSGVLAAGGNVTVDSSAGAVTTGFASAGGDFVIIAARNSESAALQATGTIRPTAGNDIVNRGIVVAAGALTVDKAVTARGSVGLGAGGNVGIYGALGTLGDLRIDAGHTLALDADVAANGLTTLTGGDIHNRAKLSSGGDLVMQARNRLASGDVGTGAMPFCAATASPWALPQCSAISTLSAATSR